MATITGVQGELLTTGTTAETAIVISDAPSQEGPVMFMIEVISGSVKFGIGSIASGAYANPAASKRIYTCLPNQLRCKQASSGDTFVITCARDL